MNNQSNTPEICSKDNNFFDKLQNEADNLELKLNEKIVRDNIKKTFEPFSNHTEYEVWHALNCFQCSKYESESATVEEAGCPLAFYLDFATVADGTIPMETANAIGIENNKLVPNCKKIKHIKTK